MNKNNVHPVDVLDKYVRSNFSEEELCDDYAERLAELRELCDQEVEEKEK